MQILNICESGELWLWVLKTKLHLDHSFIPEAVKKGSMANFLLHLPNNLRALSVSASISSNGNLTPPPPFLFIFILLPQKF